MITFNFKFPQMVVIHGLVNVVNIQCRERTTMEVFSRMVNQFMKV